MNKLTLEDSFKIVDKVIAETVGNRAWRATLESAFKTIVDNLNKMDMDINNLMDENKKLNEKLASITTGGVTGGTEEAPVQKQLEYK